jgi:hypothetical protein
LLRPADAGLDAMPAVVLTGTEIDDAVKGRFVRPSAGMGLGEDGELVRLLGDSNRIVGIARRDGRRLAPEKMAVP